MKQIIEMIKQIVENIELNFCQCSPQPHGERHFIKSRSVVLTMPRLSLKVLRKPEIQIWIAAHAIAREPLYSPCISF